MEVFQLPSIVKYCHPLSTFIVSAVKADIICSIAIGVGISQHIMELLDMGMNFTNKYLTEPLSP